MNNNTNSPTPGRGLAIASLVIGIVALILLIFIFISLLVYFTPIILFANMVLAIVGLIFGVHATKQLAEVGAAKGMAIAGIVLCVMALTFTLLVVIACAIWAWACAACVACYHDFPW